MRRLAFWAAALFAAVGLAVQPEDKMSFPVAYNPVIPDGVVVRRPPLTTSQKLLYLPRKKAGFGFVSNIEQIAYISPDQVSCIHFQPINNSKGPELYVEVPPFVEMYGGFRDFTMEKAGNVYHFKPGAQAAKYTFYWKLMKPMADGTKLTVKYWGKWPKGTQEPQTLAVEVVRIPEAKGFRNLPVYFSMPSDFFSSYPDIAGLKRCGFNLLDLWTYVEPGNDWGWPCIEATQRKCAEVPGLEPIAWVREWWWHKGRESEEGAAVFADGTKTHAALCLSYRGEHYRRWIEQGKRLIDRGFYFHTVDPEMYGQKQRVDQDNGEAICYCDTCRKEWTKYKAAHPDGTRFDFAARRYADFFKDYRAAMEKYIREKKLPGKFKFMVYDAYHRSFESFANCANYKDSHSYRNALEDPVHFKGVFDILAPMIYTDVYANYNPYDMLLPWRDVHVLDKIVGGEIPIAPILCAGYPFQKAFDSDNNAEMIKWNMLEAISAGAKGFGFWGECPFDAKDMKSLAEVVNLLAPYEDIIATGRPDDANVTCVTKNAVVKRITSAKGSLVFVSEYSERPLEVTVEAKVGGRKVRKTVCLAADRVAVVAL